MISLKWSATTGAADVSLEKMSQVGDFVGVVTLLAATLWRICERKHRLTRNRVVRTQAMLLKSGTPIRVRPNQALEVLKKEYVLILRVKNMIHRQ